MFFKKLILCLLREEDKGYKSGLYPKHPDIIEEIYISCVILVFRIYEFPCECNSAFLKAHSFSRVMLSY
jgi:hypothetical protein